MAASIGSYIIGIIERGIMVLPGAATSGRRDAPRVGSS